MGLADGREWQSAQRGIKAGAPSLWVHGVTRATSSNPEHRGAIEGAISSWMSMSNTSTQVQRGRPSHLLPFSKLERRAADEEGIEPKHFGGEAGC